MGKELTIINRNGQLATDSREVADMIGKQHAHLLRDIQGYIETMDKSENPKLDSLNFFIPSTYKTEGNNKTYDCFLLTKIGCDMVANKMTGEKGVIFTAIYVTKFEEMEKQLAIPKLSKELQAIFLLDERTEDLSKRIGKLENNMTIDYSQQEELRTKANHKIIGSLKGKDAPAYKELNKKAFQLFWRDYKRVMNVNSYKNTAVKDFEMALEFITKWLPTRELELMIVGANSQGRMVMYHV